MEVFMRTRMMLLFMMLTLIAASAFADSFLGVAARFDRSLHNGTEINPDFADFSTEPVSIGDFSFGLGYSFQHYFVDEDEEVAESEDGDEKSQSRQERSLKWKKRIGIRVDLVAFYVPENGYDAIGEALSGTIDGLSETLTGALGGLMGGGETAPASEENDPFAAFKEIDHSFEFELNPMLVIGRKFVTFYAGPGASFTWNVSRFSRSSTALESGDSDALALAFADSGITGISGVTDAAALKEVLTWQQQMALYGGELDFNIKAGMDFRLGKVVLGVNYVWDMNLDLGKWTEGGTFSENMDAIFDNANTSGKLTASLLFRL